MVALLFIVLFSATVIVAGLKDATSYRIPNWISLILIAAFVPAVLVAGLGPMQIFFHAVVGLGALALAMTLFGFGWVGGGDAKLFAATALWLGWPGAIFYLLAAAMAGGAVALLLLSLRANWARYLIPPGPAWVERLREPDGDLPYGIALAFGALWVLPGSTLGAALIAAS